MDYIVIVKKVWDKLQEIHQEVRTEYLIGNLISNSVSKMKNGVVDSKEDRLEEIVDLRTKLDLALKRIDKLQAYDNKDHVSMVSNQYCEGLEAEVISLRAYIEESNKKNEDLLHAFEEQENGLKEKIIKLKQQVEEGRKIEEILKKHEKKYHVEINILKGKL